MPRGKKTANPARGAKSSSTSARKASGKRARSPEPTVAVSGGSDVAQPKNKRSKQAASHATTQPTATEVPSTVQINESHPPPPNYTGNFDLYNMELPFLSKVYLPQGTSIPQYEELYKTILTYQVKNDKTARFFLASPTDVNDTSVFTSRAIEDPMEDFPFDISILSIKHHTSLSLPSDRLPSAAVAGADSDSPGVSASMSLTDDHCGIQSASGSFKLKRIWTKATSSGTFLELFAGYLTFDVSYSGMYRRKGHGTSQKHKWGFWAIRARTGDDGMEVGLRPRLPVAVRANGEIPPTHPVAAAVYQPASGTAKQAAPQAITAPKFSGKFNLYSMCELIADGHVPGKPFPSPEDVYIAIANADPKVTAKCSLNSADSEGRFRGATICDPFVEQPYDVVITSIEEEESLSFTEEDLGQFPERDTDLDPTGPGMTAQITLSGGHPGVLAASGYIKFVRVWAKASESGELLEVFEAYLNLDVHLELNPKLHGQRFRGHGGQECHGIAFWAIRAGKDEEGNDEEDEGDWFSESSESHFC